MQMKMSLPLSPLAVASAISHIALAFILLDTRVELSGVWENAPASHRSLLGDAHVPELRKEIELINARFEGLQSSGAAEAAELRDELKRINKEMKVNTGKVDELRLDVDELRGPKRRRRRRRRAQNAQTCDAQSFRGRTDAAMDACCPDVSGSGQGHRILQADCELPDTCPSAECAATFTTFVDDCTDMLGADELVRLRGLYANCQELQSNAQLMLEDAEPAMIFHVLVFDDAAAQAQSMFGGGSDPGPGHALDPLQPLPPPPALPAPPPPGGSEAVALDEFQAICTKANLATCAPTCNAETHGFLLNIQIDGRGTVMTCTMFNGYFSWQGQASLGGYIGSNSEAFFSSVVSGAAGTYMCELTEGAGISTDLNAERGQILSISGSFGATAWGSGGFDLSDGASLTLTNMAVAGQVTVAAGAALTLDTVVMQPSACVGTTGSAQVTLLNTATPEQCLVNVQWDGNDPAAFLSNLGSGRSGTYVLRVTGPLTITAVNVGPQQDAQLISAGGGAVVTFSEEVTVAAGARFSISGGIDAVAFHGTVTVAQGASASLSVTASTVTFEKAVDLEEESSLSIGGTIGGLAFPAGLHTGSGAAVLIRSDSPSSIAVAMGTTWYAVDPSSNQGSVTFGAVGLLSTNGQTLIGTAEGSLPGSLSVQLNGQQPGGGGPQSGAVLLAEDGTIAIPPEVSAAVGQVFTDDRIAEFVSVVNAGAPGMYGLQLNTDGQANEVDGLSVSSGQDVRIFSVATESGLRFKHELRVELGGTLAVTGTISPLAFTGGLAVVDGAALTISGGVALSTCDVTLAIGSSVGFGSGVSVIPLAGGDAAVLTELPSTMPGTITATFGGEVLGTLSRGSDGTLSGTGMFKLRMADLIEWTAGGDAGALQLCLADDAPAAVGTTQRCPQCSPTVRVPCDWDRGPVCRQDESKDQLTLQCGKPGGAAALCTVQDRLELHGNERDQQPDETTLIRLRFANLHGRSVGGAIQLTGSGLLFVFGCAFEHNSVPGGSSAHGGAIDVSVARGMNSMLVVSACSFVGNTAPGNGGHGAAIAITATGNGQITLVISASSFSGNTNIGDNPPSSAIADRVSAGWPSYTDGEASQGINEPERGTCLCQAGFCVCG